MYIVKAIISITLFLAVFIGVLASPIIYVNYNQKKYFKKLAEKFNLKLVTKQNPIIRDFPFIKGFINNNWVTIESTSIGEYQHSSIINKQKFASPAVKIGILINKTKVDYLVIKQKKDILINSNISTFDFFTYFDVEFREQKNESFRLSINIQKKIINFCLIHDNELSIALNQGSLNSYSSFELTSEKKFNLISDKLEIMLEIIKTLSP